MIENIKYLVLSLLILICSREALKFGDSRGESSKRCHRCYNNAIPFTGEAIALGDTINYGNFLEGRELESYFLSADTESYSYVGDKKTLPFFKRPLFSYTKTSSLESISIGDKTYLRQNRGWIRLRDKEVPLNAILQRNQAEHLKKLSFGREVGEPVNEREKKKINRSIMEMEERIERLKESA